MCNSCATWRDKLVMIYNSAYSESQSHISSDPDQMCLRKPQFGGTSPAVYLRRKLQGIGTRAQRGSWYITNHATLCYRVLPIGTTLCSPNGVAAGFNLFVVMQSSNNNYRQASRFLGVVHSTGCSP